MMRKTSLDQIPHELDQDKLLKMKGNEHITKCKAEAWVIVYCYASTDITTLITGSKICKFMNEVLRSDLPWYQNHKYIFNHQHLKYKKLIDEKGVKYINKYGFNWNHRIQSLSNVIKEQNETIKKINQEKLVGNNQYSKEELSKAVHQYKNGIQIIGTLNIVSDLFEIMNKDRLIEQQKINLIINTNLSQTQIKIKESQQALHQARQSRVIIGKIKNIMNDDDKFEKEYKLLQEKVENRYEIAINLIGFLNARFSNVPTQGLKKGSVIIHNQNHFPGIFQNSHVLITKFRRTGIEGSHICEGIIINKPSNFKTNKLNKKCDSDDESEESMEEPMITEEEGMDENKKIQNNKKKLNQIKIYLGGPCEMKKKFQLHNNPNVEMAEKVIDGVQVGGNADFEKMEKSGEFKVRGQQGQAAWFEGQLDGEIENDGWQLNNEIKADDIFKDYASVNFNQ